MDQTPPSHHLKIVSQVVQEDNLSKLIFHINNNIVKKKNHLIKKSQYFKRYQRKLPIRFIVSLTQHTIANEVQTSLNTMFVNKCMCKFFNDFF